LLCQAEGMALANSEVVRDACHYDYPDTCAWEVTVEGGRAIDDGDRVSVFNDRGTLEVQVVVTDRVQPGLVVVPFGWWGPAVNALTNPTVGRRLGSAAFHDTLVEIERVGP